jgi:hypothetical protein
VAVGGGVVLGGFSAGAGADGSGLTVASGGLPFSAALEHPAGRKVTARRRMSNAALYVFMTTLLKPGFGRQECKLRTARYIDVSKGQVDHRIRAGMDCLSGSKM